ncbi:phosphotransferase [Mesorhizobium sp. B1-1-4]|uniref:phosphotransferase n=1 Tax=Mesorhizobium sp. B1-1-4 TaxID=2589980 RepID=UPI00112A3622|nr:phosphotransferase [Mesorhizobium sp. B1-1-4]TPN43611.1 phosphotransferase [Mesorhizobium sp. B1-1-4]
MALSAPLAGPAAASFEQCARQSYLTEMALAEKGSTPRKDLTEVAGTAATNALSAILAKDWDGLVNRAATSRLDRQTWSAARIKVAAEAGAPGLLVPTHRGIDSTRLELSMEGQRPSLLLKVIHPDQRRYIDTAASFDAQRKAAILGCAPDILVSDAVRGIALMDFLDGWRTARVNDLRNADVMDAVLAIKRRIHSGPRLTRTWSVFDRIRILQAEIARNTSGAPSELTVLQDDVFRIERMIEAAGVDTVPAHADGLASNILIDTHGNIQLVDFDEARNVDPYFEFGILMNEAFGPEEEMLPALEMFEGRARLESLRRAKLYAVADDLAWTMWGLVMDAVSARKDVEFFRYACWRLIRCRTTLAGVDLDPRAGWL